MVLMVMAAIIIVTSQLVVSARRSSGDQLSAVQAQYAAESGVARSQARLQATTYLFSQDIRPSTLITSSAMSSKINLLCTGSSTPLPAVLGLLCGSNPNAAAQQPQLTNGTSFTSAGVSGRLSVLSDFLSASNFTARGFDMTGTTPTEVLNALFSSAGSPLSGHLDDSAAAGNYTTTFSASLRLKVLGVSRPVADSYRIYVQIPEVQADGTGPVSARRQLRVNAAAKVYTVLLSRGSFAKYALFTNHHFISPTDESNNSPIYFTSNTRFDGPVHTNQKAVFSGSASFSGEYFESAGCPAGQISESMALPDGTTGPGCLTAAVQGAFFGGSGANNFAAPNAMGSTVDATTNITTLNKDGVTPSFLGTPKFNADFVPMPSNSLDQTDKAKNGGLFLPTGAAQLTLSVGTVNLNNGEGASNTQLITYKVGTATTQLAFQADGKMSILSGGAWVPAVQVPSVPAVANSGLWVAAPAGTAAGSFNGVLFANGTIDGLGGPDRTGTGTAILTSTAANTPPALASFAQLTVAATGNIAITNDLRYQTPPTADPAPKNILGIYSAGGDVNIVSPNSCGSTPCAAGASAPPDVTIQAVLMANGPTGRVRVLGHDASGPSGAPSLGQVHLLGGIIENYYGAFGTFGSNGATGYGRDFVYDKRTSDGVAPPFFPTQKSWDMKVTDTPVTGEGVDQAFALKTGTAAQGSYAP